MNLAHIKFAETELEEAQAPPVTTRESDIDQATRRAPGYNYSSMDTDPVDYNDKWNGCNLPAFVSRPITPVEQLEGETIKYTRINVMAVVSLIGFLVFGGIACFGHSMRWW